jgi:hypothetical protein
MLFFEKNTSVGVCKSFSNQKKEGNSRFPEMHVPLLFRKKNQKKKK